MARFAFFFNSRIGDRRYSADSLTRFFVPFFTDGVFNGGMRVRANGDMTVTLEPGRAFVGGNLLEIDEAEAYEVARAGGSLPRVDSIVIRRDLAARDVYPHYMQGAYAAKPAPPALVREGNIYDLRLCNIYVAKGVAGVTQANIEDRRPYLPDCGWVAATVDQMDFAQITAQFDAFFSEYRQRILDDHSAYTRDIEDLYVRTTALINTLQQDADTAAQAFLGWIESFKTFASGQFNEWFSPFKTQREADVRAWFQMLQDELDENQAVNLANMIYSHENTRLNTAEVHGSRLKDGKWQVDIGIGWATLATVPVGYTAGYFDALGFTAAAFDMVDYTAGQFDTQIEVEV